jgi:hypothetical protein
VLESIAGLFLGLASVDTIFAEENATDWALLKKMQPTGKQESNASR